MIKNKNNIVELLHDTKSFTYFKGISVLYKDRKYINMNIS
jgi:hypothetical protein